MNLGHLKNALLLSKKLHFTHVAEEANIVQPALSRQIRQIEEELGLQLFERTKRNVTLTQPGAYFFEKVDQILTLYDQVCDSARIIQEKGSAVIRIGFTHSVLQSILPTVIKTVEHIHPGIQTILTELNNKDQYAALKNGTLDFSFATNPKVPDQLNSRVISRNNFCVLLPNTHAIHADNFTDFSVFSEEKFIFPPANDGAQYPKILKSICTDAGFSPNITHMTGSASTTFKLVEKQMGIGIEPITSLLDQDLPIRFIELKDIPQKAELTMVWNDNFEKEFPEIFRGLGKLKGIDQTGVEK